MWGFFKAKPTCPIEPDEAKWVEARFQWLLDEFGANVPAEAQVVLPTRDYFPDPFEGAPEDVIPMLTRVAEYMRVDPGRFELQFYDEGGGDPWAMMPVNPGATAGWYLQGGDESGARSVIGVELKQLADPMSLVATLAHEVAHELLLGQRRISPEEQDHEPLTDLLTVFLGLGIFTANATIRDRGWSSGVWAGWHTARHGYLDQRMLGYALGKFARARGEQRPAWVSHVRPDVRVSMEKTLKWLGASES